MIKRIEDLTEKDFVTFPVWEFVNDDKMGETSVRPVKKLPVKSTEGKIIGLKVQFANGKEYWSMIGNVNVSSLLATEHFITISILIKKKWFHLARYHDADYKKMGPAALSKYLKLDIDKVFPISYDISPYVNGEESVVKGKIHKTPKKKFQNLS